jgi:hypothetical protein
MSPDRRPKNALITIDPDQPADDSTIATNTLTVAGTWGVETELLADVKVRVKVTWVDDNCDDGDQVGQLPDDVVQVCPAPVDDHEDPLPWECTIPDLANGKIEIYAYLQVDNDLEAARAGPRHVCVASS